MKKDIRKYKAKGYGYPITSKIRCHRCGHIQKMWREIYENMRQYRYWMYFSSTTGRYKQKYNRKYDRKKYIEKHECEKCKIYIIFCTVN